MGKYLVDRYGNEMDAFNLEGLKDYIEKCKAAVPEDWEDDIIPLQSGTDEEGERWFGIGGEGVAVSVKALDNFYDWWDAKWDAELKED